MKNPTTVTGTGSIFFAILLFFLKAGGIVGLSWAGVFTAWAISFTMTTPLVLFLAGARGKVKR